MLIGSIALLEIDRLIPDYVTHVSASMNTGVFTLTEKGLNCAEISAGVKLGDRVCHPKE
jgi:hypothetical protein